MSAHASRARSVVVSMSLSRRTLDADVAPGHLEHQVRRLLATPLRVLLAGETGTGKNHLAELFRADAITRGKPFVEVNSANLPDELFEGEMFGARRGAFTGAQTDRAGLLERADDGTLFLNEVGELSMRGQAKLLMVLDGGLYRRLGESTDRRFHGRVISATNRILAEEVRADRFRADLHYRLAQVTLVVPPLRDCPHRITVLAGRFLAAAAAARGIELRFDRRALARLVDYRWPGNIRQLRGVVEATAWLAPADGWITLEAVIEQLDGASLPTTTSQGVELASSLRDKVDDLERCEIAKALHAVRGNKTHAAARLGLSLPGLRLKLRRLGLDRGTVAVSVTSDRDARLRPRPLR